MMYHAFDPKDVNYVGRQVYLDEVNWTKDGWATINNGKGASKTAAAPLGVAEKDEEYRFADEFDQPTLRFGWQWLASSIPTYAISGGFLNLSPNAAQMTNPIGGVMAYYTTKGDYTATTQIDRKSLTSGAVAGLSAFGDGENALGFGLKDNKIVVWRRERNNHRTLSTHEAPTGDNLYLRMTARDGTFYSFAVSRDGKTFTPVGAEQNGIICRLGTEACAWR
jgi:beta-xylosidase